jgi:hypothetical protein
MQYARLVVGFQSSFEPQLEKKRERKKCGGKPEGQLQIKQNTNINYKQGLPYSRGAHTHKHATFSFTSTLKPVLVFSLEYPSPTHPIGAALG